MLSTLWDVKEKGLPKIGFIGFGISCRGVYEALKKEIAGAKITVRSKKTEVLPDGVDGIFGEKYLYGIEEDILIISPGVRWDKKELLEARGKNKVLTSDANLFFECNSSPVFAVTGSDGKSTTVSLTTHLLTYGKRFSNVSAVGNIGKSFCKELFANGGIGAFVAELSSFQLMNLSPRSKRAVITNLTPNHEDWHLSKEEYKEAKLHIFDNCEEPVGNADFPDILPTGACFSAFSVVKDAKVLSTICDVTYTISENDILRNGKKHLPRSVVSIPGEHGLKNVLAALSLTDGYVDKEEALAALSSFVPLSHRTQLITKIGGVSFVDSSIDSTPSRTATALSSFSSPVILLLGGHGKGVPYEPLLEAVSKHVRSIVLFGEIAGDLEIFFAEHKSRLPEGLSIRRVFKMADAVKEAFHIAKPGDVVLLSPSATSFDEFENYEKRGEAFRQEVLRL